MKSRELLIIEIEQLKNKIAEARDDEVIVIFELMKAEREGEIENKLAE